ncbi:UNVERIFIED_CONTAM: hypothetical protein Scaly_2129300 [Sesamum calycinum]|uniref:Uncharacterized protein n=1 Tax=Sesamum calycinum TaxID=2727403 RepID=A0AAW2MNG7_9LAMI
MAGLLAWAADVVGGGGGGDRSEAEIASPDISQRLPHIHAHSLASNNALALQLNAHSATKQQAQLREVRLQEENAEYQNAISNCEMKIQERLQETEMLRTEIFLILSTASLDSSVSFEMDLIEQNLKAELQRVKASMDANNSGETNKMFNESKSAGEALEQEDAPKPALLEKLENKKKELVCFNGRASSRIEKKWQQVQENALKQPTPAQREKTLDKQLHSLIEQLAVQAEGLISEIHLKEMELEKLNGLWKRIESSSLDANTAGPGLEEPALPRNPYLLITMLILSRSFLFIQLVEVRACRG